MKRPWLARTAVVAGYALVAAVFTWPLVRHLSSHVPGPLSGDTGVYLWNLWAFNHELWAGRSPFFASTIFVSTAPVDLSLHNYTVAFNLAALPLLPFWDVVSVYNVLLLATLVINGTVGYALAFRLTQDRGVAWLGGLAFGFSPFVMARTTGHLSLVAVAPLALFWLCLDRWRRSGALAPAAGAGASLALAFYSDVYYAVYCGMLAALVLAPVRLRSVGRPAGERRALRLGADVAIGLAAGAVCAIVVSGGATISVLGATIGLRTVYTPMLLLTVALAVRLAVGRVWDATVDPTRLGRVSVAGAGVAAVVANVLLAPWMLALARRLADGGSIGGPNVWRSGVPGVDLLDLLRLNPSNSVVRLLADPGDWRAMAAPPIETTAAVPLVALAVIAVAVWRYRAALPGVWVLITGVFGILALGPFVHVGGLNTHVPGLWSLLRYVPIVGSARSPSRFAAVVALGVAVLFAVALAHLVARAGRHRTAVLGAVGALLVLELAPFPRALHPAEIPAVYQTIARDPGPVSVLHLPFGFRDGTRTYGDYDNARQYFQTQHTKSLIGGYVSRVSPADVGRVRRSRVLRTLLWLSEGRPYRSAPASVLRARGARLARRLNLGYVVVDASRTPAPLLAYAKASFGLERMEESGGLVLYRVPSYDGPEAAQGFSAGLPHARGVTLAGPLDDTGTAR